MTFLIRTVDRTATGREIVRDRKVESDTLTIGRATTNDIVLPDLAVEQHHATVSVAERGRLHVAAASSRNFLHDGRSSPEAYFDPANGAELGFGTYELDFSLEADGTVLVTISRVEKDYSNRDAVRGFDLASAMPGKRAMAWIGLAVILLAFLAVPVWSSLTRGDKQPGADGPDQVAMDSSWSTGKLSEAHHALEQNCEACHVQPFVAVRDETCLTCHEDIGDHAKPGRLLTARGPMSTGDAFLWSVAETFGKEGPAACTTCHTEHEGAGRMLPARQQFCADCHDGMDARLTDTELANAHDFGKDHPELKAAIHQTLGSAKLTRVVIDGKARENNGLRFPHDMHLSTTNGVARMAGNLEQYGKALECADCHTPTEDKYGFLPVVMEDSCESCHSLVYDKVGSTFRTLRHGDVAQMRADLIALDRAPRSQIIDPRRRPGEFKRGGRYFQDFGSPTQNYIGIASALGKDGVCGECHLPAVKDGQQSVMPVFQSSGYFLNGRFDHEAHTQEKCTSCHLADTSKSARDLLLPDLKSCRECHQGEKAVKADVPSSCAMCHSYHPPNFRRDEDTDEAAAPNRVALIARRKGDE
ncbi:cytochrome c3 family protein [Erythrobacter mangrovi]|uniref:Cytochrome c3 family protein n=1 Tax=Erythrobacter mangrovi TaxID=2739433 RepID=A0A7D4C5V7_9SPHN|nr:cytochrome c3 family protein [Erythrobacter mangrovi]QKG72145.1 cytochrome c3 family protein [Erythrobacter mangrovi]